MTQRVQVEEVVMMLLDIIRLIQKKIYPVKSEKLIDSILKNISLVFINISFGFTSMNEEGYHIPLCVVCGETLSNSAMYPDKLNRHFTTKHADLASKSKNYFERLLSMQKKQAKYFEKMKKRKTQKRRKESDRELQPKDGKEE